MVKKKQAKTGVFVGRFQPFHEGHKKCIERILEIHDRCLVFIRCTEKSDKNPFSYNERVTMIRESFPKGSKVVCRPLPDPGADLTVYIGRDVGYDLIKLDEATESISATNIREKLYGKKYRAVVLRHADDTVSCKSADSHDAHCDK